jgi:hypothetical protein
METDFGNTCEVMNIAIMPGQRLAMLYRQFGARLLEQNVRSLVADKQLPQFINRKKRQSRYFKYFCAGQVFNH